VSYKSYSKTYMPESIIVSPELAAEVPGVGAYNIEALPGKDKTKYSLTGKGKMYNDASTNPIPGCNHYNPKSNWISNTRYLRINFGFGNKLDFTKTHQRTPGPGQYLMPSTFDRFSNVKRKLFLGVKARDSKNKNGKSKNDKTKNS